jgi:hypothetical protein
MALPDQWTSELTKNGGAATVYSDATTKRAAVHAQGMFGPTFTIIDCDKGIKYDNSYGSCTISSPIAYVDCPVESLGGEWPPAAMNFYGSSRASASYASSDGTYDTYTFSDDMREVSSTFQVHTDTQLPYKATVSQWDGMKTTTIIIESMDMSPPPDSAFAKPASCVPAPPPRPDSECIDEMKKVGCDITELSDYKSCHKCDKDNKDNLGKANCPHSQCDSICKAALPNIKVI